MVGRLTASDRLPASLISVPNNRTRVGIRNSPPATPSNEAITPITKPAMIPAIICAAPVNSGDPIVGEQQNACDENEQRSNQTIERFRSKSRSPSRTNPSARETACQQVDDDMPTRPDR